MAAALNFGGRSTVLSCRIGVPATFVDEEIRDAGLPPYHTSLPFKVWCLTRWARDATRSHSFSLSPTAWLEGRGPMLCFFYQDVSGGLL